MGLTIYFGNLLGKWLDQKYTQQVSLESIITLLAVFIAMYTLIKLAINISK
ncbi:MAG: AtpZ/AtpI family protein [Flavobacteriaceae bacterium]|nr:AtpZ/AtpI family protein [Flavobacteriaceae bacterium]